MAVLEKLVIANRGEIALRIMRACHSMGIKTVAVHSTVDRNLKHVALADEAVCIGPAASTDSYLSIPAIIAATEVTDSVAVHPGYGFLAENADFAERVEAAGMTWVGPPPGAMRLMGSKTESRKLAKSAGAPIIPGLMEPITDISELETFVDEHGLPVLLKAVAGGGGKGMRVVADRDELAGSYERACSEGQAYFGDGRVYVERLVDSPRHIEVQVVADREGNAVYVGERECSIQRRHQKVVEECPSPVVGPELRKRLGETALAIVKASSYHSLGTVEFLLDSNGEFFFLEMNTRLQVEHPITEEVFGVDLVQEQIKLALGEPLSFRQEELVPRGHAIECRIYAEDPLRNFAPSPGRISLWVRPGGPGVRLDSGVIAESVVPLDYDPMLAKLIVWAPDRATAMKRLHRALSEFQVRGVSTTLTLFRALVGMEAFRTADFHTGFLDKLLTSGDLEKLHGQQDPEAEKAAMMAAACLATASAGRLPDDLFAHGDDSSWWCEGTRLLHGRFPR